MAAAVERPEGRHVAGGPAARGSRRGGALSALAAAPAAHAAGADLPVGASGARRAGFRHLDENGYAVYRQLVPGAGLENHPSHHSPRRDGQRPAKTDTCTWFLPKKKWSRCCANRRAARRSFRISERPACQRIPAGPAGHAVLPAREGVERGAEPPASR